MALKDFKKAIEINSDYSMALCNTAAIYHLQEHYTGALADLEKAVKLQPYNATALLNRGITREMLRDVDGACQDWQKAYQLGMEKANEYYINNCE
jgi:tetratricopeptide (TPR) repeat protein